MKPYPMVLRERELKDCDAGLGTPAVAKKTLGQRFLGPPAQTASTGVRANRAEAAAYPLVPKLAAHADCIRGLLAATLDPGRTPSGVGGDSRHAHALVGRRRPRPDRQNVLRAAEQDRPEVKYPSGGDAVASRASLAPKPFDRSRDAIRAK